MLGKYALMLPGQGVLRSQLLAPYAKYRPLYKHLLEEADDALQEPISRRLESENDQAQTADWLSRTSNAQPSILATTYIIHHIIKCEHGVDLAGSAQYIMGHSLGEFTALVLSGVLDLPAALKIVRKRGLLMEKMSSDANYGMRALLISTADKMQQVKQMAAEQGVLANHNSASQLVISGEESQLDAFVNNANAQSKLVARSVPLPVSVPFHNQILQKIEAELANYVNSFSHSALATSLVSNLTAKPAPDAMTAIANTLHSTSQPVLWADSVSYIQSQGIEKAVCLGPGLVLQGLLKKISLDSISLDTPDTFHSLAK